MVKLAGAAIKAFQVLGPGRAGNPTEGPEHRHAADIMGALVQQDIGGHQVRVGIEADMEIEDVCEKFGGKQFSDFKQDLTDLAVEKLAPMQGEMRRLMDDPVHVDGVIADGVERARAIAEPILAEVHDLLGFLRPGRG